MPVVSEVSARREPRPSAVNIFDSHKTLIFKVVFSKTRWDYGQSIFHENVKIDFPDVFDFCPVFQRVSDLQRCLQHWGEAPAEPRDAITLRYAAQREFRPPSKRGFGK